MKLEDAKKKAELFHKAAESLVEWWDEPKEDKIVEEAGTLLQRISGFRIEDDLSKYHRKTIHYFPERALEEYVVLAEMKFFTPENEQIMCYEMSDIGGTILAISSTANILKDIKLAGSLIDHSIYLGTIGEAFLDYAARKENEEK